MSLRAEQIVQESPEFEVEIERYRQYLKDEAIKVYDTFVPGGSASSGGEFFRVRTASDDRTDLSETRKALHTAADQLDATEEWLIDMVTKLGTRAFKDVPLPPMVRARRSKSWADFIRQYHESGVEC